MLRIHPGVPQASLTLAHRPRSTLAGSVDVEPEDALTAFFAALRSGDGAIVREYLSQGLPALGQACEGDGVTPLHIAADAGHLGVVRCGCYRGAAERTAELPSER